MPVATAQDASALLDRIAALEDALRPFAEFAKVFETQQLGALVPKRGEVYAIVNRAGEASIDVEHLERAYKTYANLR